MADGTVEVSHDGFYVRAEQFSLPILGFSENIAVNGGVKDPIWKAIDGLKNSPGHRKNMLADKDVCAIAVT
jgi:uncharacterized protein YkwD